MRKNGQIFYCPVCNAEFYRAKYRIDQAKDMFCSLKCKGQYKTIENLEKATARFDYSWQRLIAEWYLVDKIAIREITRRLGVTNRVIPRALRILGIPQRSASERVALQWTDNPERRKDIADVFAPYKETSWNKGLTKKSHPAIKRQADGMIGNNNPMYGKRGKLHPQYKNGKYTADKKRYWSTSEYQQWRKAVFERDDYTCKCCSDNKGGNLEAHHIKSVADFPELIFDVSNGVTHCQDCHQTIHKIIHNILSKFKHS